MDTEQPAFNVCPNCGTPAEASDRFCRRCGLPRYEVPEGQFSARPADVGGRGNRRSFVFLALAVAVGVLIAGGAFFVLQSGILTPKHTIAGTLALYGDATSSIDQITMVGSTCHGAGGYSDITAGMPVTVKDETGKILSATSLGAGTGTTSLCQFTFTLTDVGDASIYSVEGGHRGAVSYPKSQMEAQNWTVGLQIGQ